MSAITSSSVSVSLAPATSASNTVAAAAEQQKQQQRQEVREAFKPIVEQVYISKQAQRQFDTYVASAANAADRYDHSVSPSLAGVSTEQVLDTVKTLQNRQTVAALAQYAQQQAQANPPQPRAEVEEKPTTSIQAIA